VTEQTRPKVLLVGHGRSGKDEAGEWFSRETLLKFSGSASKYLLPFVAAELGLAEDVAYAKRHDMRDDWYRIGNRLREEDRLILVNQALQHGDVVAGIRSKVELADVIALQLVAHVVWIERQDTPLDPTLDFTLQDCLNYLSRARNSMQLHVVFNNADLPTFHARLRRMVHGWSPQLLLSLR